MNSTLAQSLQTLADSGLIGLAAAAPEPAYIFRHALVHEATYHTLLRPDRRHLHRVVGEVLEREAGEGRAALAPLLAQHFDEAGDESRAIHYYRLAGDQAAGIYANAEAVTHYARALELIAGGAPAPGALGELYAKRGRALELSGQYEQALANYGAMRDWARRHADRALELAALVYQAQVHSMSNTLFDAERGSVLAQEALQLAAQLGDGPAQVKILWSEMNRSIFSNRMTEATQFAERALRLARELGQPEPLAYLLNDLARVYFSQGQVDRSLASLEEARLMWRELGNLPMLADSLSSSAAFLFFSGQYTSSLRFADEALALSRSIHNRWDESYSQIHAGNIYWDRGEPDRALATMEACVRLSEDAGFITPQLYTRANLGLIYGALGDVPRGIALARQAAGLAAGHMRSFQPHALARLASLHLLHGDVAAAEQALAEARPSFSTANPMVGSAVFLAEVELALAQGQSARALQTADEFVAYHSRFQLRHAAADALYLKGRALLASGRPDEASALFAEAYRAADHLGQRRLLWPLLLRQAEQAEQQAQAEPALMLRRQARAIVLEIAARTPAEWRASFLAQPAARTALEAGSPEV